METSDTPPKHGLAGHGPPPARADWVIPQGHADYTPSEHATWKFLFERQCQQVANRACEEFLEGLSALPFEANAIPNFDEVSEVLAARTGWRIVAVPGLIPDEVFFAHLAARRFPAGNFIRTWQQLDYLQEPDVFHDLFGHVPMLMNPVLADFLQAYGEGGLRARSLGFLPMLARVYWHTVEFGLVDTPRGLRFYGAGMASSFTEARHCIESPVPQRLRFRLQRVMRTRYRIDDFQPTYFVLKNLSELLDFTRIDFAPIYAAAAKLPELAPTDRLDDDEVIRGVS